MCSGRYSRSYRDAICDGVGPEELIAPVATSDLLVATEEADHGVRLIVGATARTGEAGDEVVGTVVRFSAGSTAVELTNDEDDPAVRDFLSMLPLTLT